MIGWSFWTHWCKLEIKVLKIAGYMWLIGLIFHAMLQGNMKKRLEIIVKLIKSDPKHPFMSTFTVSLVIAKRKQTQLEKNHG